MSKLVYIVLLDTENRRLVSLYIVLIMAIKYQMLPILSTPKMEESNTKFLTLHGKSLWTVNVDCAHSFLTSPINTLLVLVIYLIQVNMKNLFPS